MKPFKNDRTTNNKELPIRKGFMVPDGSVNLAWTKSPSLNPGSNLLVLNSNSAEGPEKTSMSLAYANALGILHDADGNQTWPEEFPVVTDEFLSVDDVSTVAQILPYVHYSRFLHLDYQGLGYTGSMTEILPQPEVKIVDQNGKEYTDDDDNPKYKIYVVNVPVERPSSFRDAAYRLCVFLDTDPKEDELYLTYHKVEIDHLTNTIRDEEIGYREPVNAMEYFKYVSEESEVLDHSSYDKKKYSTKPIDIKDQVVGRTQPSYKGWSIQVPKKAIPDPRNFQIFRWRLACEYSRKVDPTEAKKNDQKKSVVNAGIVTFNSTNGHTQTRANYLFSQLNKSNYNVSGLTFQNPLKLGDPAYDTVYDKNEVAGYWHVPLNSVSTTDLDQFDVLVWAPSNPTVTLDGALLAKIEYFVKVKGGTFIIESSSRSVISGIPAVGFSTALINLTDANAANKTKLNTVNLYSHQSATPNSGFGLWNQWPPNTEDLWTNNTHSSTLLQKLNFLGGWDLDLPNERVITAYRNMANPAILRTQYLTLTDTVNWEIVADAEFVSTTVRHPVLARRKYPSGGSIYVSTGSFFEDHIVQTDDGVNLSTLQFNRFQDFPASLKQDYNFSINSTNMEGEMKFRLNVFTLATAFRAATTGQATSATGYSSDYERNTTTLYSDWSSSWVINAHNDVLSQEEKARFNFALLPKVADDPSPVWMRILSDKTVSDIMAEKIKEVDPDGNNDLFKHNNALNRRYILIVTNPEVETYTYSQINDLTRPAAWTYSYSPRFEVPIGLGAYKIKEDIVAATGTGTAKQVFPPRPYKIRTTANYVSTTSKNQSVNVAIKLTGTGRRVYKLPDTVITEPKPAYRHGWYVDKHMRWSTDAGAIRQTSYLQQQAGIFQHPVGLENWGDYNYSRAAGVNNWPYWGIRTRIQEGSTGLAVNLVQIMINQAIYFNWISGPYMPEDGYFSNALGWQVIKLQQRLGAMYVDGIVDAETWSLFGYLMLNLSGTPNYMSNNYGSPHWSLAVQANEWLPLNRASTSGQLPGYTRQSWYANGPSTIREAFQLRLRADLSDMGTNGSFEMYAISIKPFVPDNDASKVMAIDWLDVGGPQTLAGYDFSRASHGNIWQPCVSGEYITLPFSNTIANNVIFRIRQDGPTGGWGTQRSLGVSDIAIHGKKYIVNQAPPPPTVQRIVPGQMIVEPFNIEVTYNTTLVSGIPKILGVYGTGIHSYIDGAKITSIDGARNLQEDDYPLNIMELKYSSYTFTPTTYNADIAAETYYVGDEGAMGYRFTYNGTNSSPTQPNFISGPKIGDGSIEYYIKTTDGAIEPFKRSFGWVTKDQGVVLICDATGKPFGFPAGAPRQGQNTEAHFTRLTMDSWETDQMLFYGFYDIKKKQFLVNSNGEPDISYYEYVRRGPENIFMAVQTSYEVDTQSNLPPSTDPVTRPFKWAMPIYGVKLRNETSVKLRNPSKELSTKDVWPIMVSTGAFSKQIAVPYSYASHSTNYLRAYADKTLTAHYIINEALKGPWSALLGRPYVDIRDEEPRLLSEDTIIVNHSPIASIKEPTLKNNPGDPVTPLFKVYTRSALGQPWTQVPMNDIKEYNLGKGTVTLKNPLLELDQRLVKISYTARDYTYQIRYDVNGKINLNPYMIRRDRPEWLDKPLYVYIKPAFVVDNETKNVIAASKTQDVVKISESNTIFGVQNEDYDPTAYLLGIIIVLSKVELNDLTLLDTRVRGGGAKHHLTISELNDEASSYWDTPAEKPFAYQRGGFVIIQLPRDVIQDFNTEAKLREVIDRNFTAGVVYELQDYDGAPLYDDLEVGT